MNSQELSTYFTIIFALVGLVWFFALPKDSSNIQISSFSNEPKPKQAFDVMHVLFSQYSKQQKWAFALLWFTIAWSVILGSYLIISIIQGNYGIELLVKGIGLAGGVGVCISAFRLYNKTSKKIEELLKIFSKKL